MFWVSAGVYRAAHIPADDGETLHWIVMSCDYLHKDWHQEPRETPRKRMVLAMHVADSKAASGSLPEKIQRCRKYQMTGDHIAEVLGIEKSAHSACEDQNIQPGDFRLNSVV